MGIAARFRPLHQRFGFVRRYRNRRYIGPYPGTFVLGANISRRPRYHIPTHIPFPPYYHGSYGYYGHCHAFVHGLLDGLVSLPQGIRRTHSVRLCAHYVDSLRIDLDTFHSKTPGTRSLAKRVGSFRTRLTFDGCCQFYHDCITSYTDMACPISPPWSRG